MNRTICFFKSLSKTFEKENNTLIDFIRFGFKFFRHGGHVSQRTDLQWAVQINTKLRKTYVIKKPYLQNHLINKLK